MTIIEAPASHRDIQALISIHKAFCETVSPPEACYAVTTRTPELAGYRYWLASEDGAPLGCIALKRLDATHGEVKTMHVLKAARGKGVGRALVDRLAREASAAGLTTTPPH